MNKHGFTLFTEKDLHEVGGTARLWRHEVTGTALLSVCNTDENKCFGVSFRTAPGGFHRCGPHPGAFCALRFGQVSGEGTLCGTAQGLSADLS